MNRQTGFTLIEVLVALGVVAIALATGLKATSALTANGERQTQMVLAQICAENELVALKLARQMPGVGDSSFQCVQAGQTFSGQLSVRPTPNPNFRRADAQVFDGAYPLLRLSTVIGQL